MAKKKSSLKKLAKPKLEYKQRKIDVSQILLQGRQVFLNGVIDENSSSDLIKELLTLEETAHAPIIMWINSPGGSCSDGFAIIDIMAGLRSPIVTVVAGQACSMAGVISVSGKQRYITENSTWMAHDVSGYICDYASKMIYRAEYVRDLQKRLFTYLGKHTKLSPTELEQARVGELWLNAEDAVKKGVADTMFKQQ